MSVPPDDGLAACCGTCGALETLTPLVAAASAGRPWPEEAAAPTAVTAAMAMVAAETAKVRLTGFRYRFLRGEDFFGGIKADLGSGAVCARVHPDHCRQVR